MNWSDLKSDIGAIAPVLGGVLGGPAGGIVGSFIANKLGVAATPDALSAALQDPKNVVELQQIASQNEAALLDFLHQEDSSQSAVNQAEASNSSLFVAGWRPAVGWSCAVAFLYSFVLAPLASFSASLVGHPVKLPDLDLTQMMPVLLGMLGIAGMRTYEKVKGVVAGH